MEINNDNGNYKSEQMTSIRHVTGIPRIIINTYVPPCPGLTIDATTLSVWLPKESTKATSADALKILKRIIWTEFGDQWTHLKDA